MSVTVCPSVSVCLSVRDHIFGNKRSDLHHFSVNVTYGRGSVLF